MATSSSTRPGTHDANHALRRPASEKRQGTKSRWGNVGGAANSTHGDLTGIGSEREYNFLELARSLLIGESNFRIACDFKELDVGPFNSEVQRGDFWR